MNIRRCKNWKKIWEREHVNYEHFISFHARSKNCSSCCFFLLIFCPNKGENAIWSRHRAVFELFPCFTSLPLKKARSSIGAPVVLRATGLLVSWPPPLQWMSPLLAINQVRTKVKAPPKGYATPHWCTSPTDIPPLWCVAFGEERPRGFNGDLWCTLTVNQAQLVGTEFQLVG